MKLSPHRRTNPLTGEDVLVSPHRTQRPWLGQVERPPIEHLPSYDPGCYLCPRNERAGGKRNPDYSGTYVFDNDFAALLPAPDSDASQPDSHPLFASRAERGVCRVVCFSPRHDRTLPELSLVEVGNVITAWTEQSRELESRGFLRYIQVFENKGAMMGCSNPHPHSQIWATESIPNEPAKELRTQRAYFDARGTPLLLDYAGEEIRRAERVVAANESFLAVVPFWATWPFEVLVTARIPAARLGDLDSAQQAHLADIFHQVTVRYDNLFEVSFPYSMGFHQAPLDGTAHPEWILHSHFYPPLLRSATVKKFMVGFELLSMPQRDITPEAAAEKLRSVSGIHYKSRG